MTTITLFTTDAELAGMAIEERNMALKMLNQDLEEGLAPDLDSLEYDLLMKEARDAQAISAAEDLQMRG